MDIKGIDINEMTSRLMCTEEDCIPIITAFYGDVKNKINLLMEEKDNEKFITLVHGIKGACANVSAFDCSEYAKMVEYKAREQGMKECYNQLVILAVKVCNLLRSVDEYLNKDENDVIHM